MDEHMNPGPCPELVRRRTSLRTSRAVRCGIGAVVLALTGCDRANRATSLCTSLPSAKITGMLGDVSRAAGRDVEVTGDPAACTYRFAANSRLRVTIDSLRATTRHVQEPASAPGRSDKVFVAEKRTQTIRARIELEYDGASADSLFDRLAGVIAPSIR